MNHLLDIQQVSPFMRQLLIWTKLHLEMCTMMPRVGHLYIWHQTDRISVILESL